MAWISQGAKTGWSAALHRLEDVVMNRYSYPGAPNILGQEVLDAVDAVEEFFWNWRGKMNSDQLDAAELFVKLDN